MDIIKFTLKILLLLLISSKICLAQESTLPIYNYNSVKYLYKSDQALAHFVGLVQAANKTIDIATFIFEPCHASTQVLLKEIELKVQQGVKVRILLDAISQKSEQKKNLIRYFNSHKIDFAFFNPSKSPTTNFRLHSKMLIVDNKTMIAGGRNLSDSYFGIDKDYNFIDEDLLISGPEVITATKQFNIIWAAELTKHYSLKPTPNEDQDTNWDSICTKNNSQFQNNISMTKEFLIKNQDRLINETKSYQCNQVSFYTDDPEFSNSRFDEMRLEGDAAKEYMTPQRMQLKKTTQAVLSFINNSKQSIRAQNWVYLPINELDDAFSGIRSKNIDIEILTNLDIEGDKETFRNMMEAAQVAIANRDHRDSQRIRLVSSQGSLRDDYELTPKSVRFFIHGKSIIRDSKDVLISSFNLDSRSLNTNVESATIVRGCKSLNDEISKRYHQVRSFHKRDIASESIPQKSPPSFWSKFLAMLSLALL